MASLLLAVAFGSAAIKALVVDGVLPRATGAAVAVAILDSTTYSRPEITAPPSLRELIRRDDNILTVLAAPDNTCGYISGLSGVTCNNQGATCAFVTTESIGAVGCCSASNCAFQIACLDYNQISTSSACNKGCSLDPSTIKCTNSTNPYCQTFSFDGGLFFKNGIMGYFCGTLNASIPLPAETTWAASGGATGSISFSQLLITMTSSTTATSSNTTNPSDSDDTGSTGVGANNTSSTTAPAGQTSSNSNVGAIVGGVVGGFAVLGLIGLGAFFIIRHNKKPNDNNNNGNPPPSGGAAPGTAHTSYYNAGPQGPNGMQASPGQAGFAATAGPYGGGGVEKTESDRLNSVSPLSSMSQADPRASVATSMMVRPPSFYHDAQQHPVPDIPANYHEAPNAAPVVHEAGGDAVGAGGEGHHRGEIAELG